MKRFDRKTLIVAAVIGLAAVSVAAAALVYVMNRPRRQKALFENAKNYMSQKDYARAVLSYRRAVSMGNPSADLFFQYGLCLEKLHDARGAFDAFQRAAGCDKNHIESRRRLVGFYYELARSALLRGEPEPQKDAVKQLQDCAETMIRLEPDKVEGYLWLARSQALRKQTEDALATIERYRAKAPNDLDAVAERASIFASADRMPEAQAEIAKALAQKPESAVLLLAAADLQRRTGDSAAEEQSLRKAAQAAPEDIRAHMQLGALLGRKGHLEEAERELAKACDLGPENGANWLVLARLRTMLNQPDKAIEAIGKAEAVSPKDPEVLIEKIRMQIAAKNLNEARAGVTTLERIKGYPAYVAYAEALVATAEEKPATAKTKFQEALFKSHDNFPDASFGLAACYRAEGDYGAAEKQLRLAARAPMFRQRASLALADMYLQEGKPEAALAECAQVQDSLRRGSGADETGRLDLTLKSLMGRAHLAQGQAATAEREFRALAEAADPVQKVSGLTWLARVDLARVRSARSALTAEDRSHLDAARKELQEAAQIAPDDAQLLLLQAQVARLLGDDKASVELERKAADSPRLAALAIQNYIGAGPVTDESAALVRSLAQRYAADVLVQSSAADFFAYAAAERNASALKAEAAQRDAALTAAQPFLEAAAQYARKAFDLQEENEAYALRLFDLLRDAKRTADARALADGLAAKPPSKALGLALQGLLLSEEGKYADAVRQFEQSASLRPDDWHVQFWLGRTYARMKGKSSDAEAALGRALELSPTATSVRAVLFRLLEDEGKLARLQSEIETAQKDSPRDLSLLTLSARLFDKAGEPEQAVARWRQIAETVPDSADYQAEYAQALVRSGKAKDAGAVARKALAINNKSLPALRALLLAQASTGDRVGAQETLRRALAERADDPALQVLAKDFYQSLGELAQAENELKKLVQSRPSDPVSHYMLADYYASQGRPEEALKEYDECTKLDAGAMFAGVGAFRVLLGQAERAADPQQKQTFIAGAEAKLAELQKASPKSITAAMAEIELLVFQRDFTRAEQKLKDAMQSFPEQGRLKVLLGRLLFEQGRTGEATAYLRTVVEQEPNLSEAHFLLAQAAFEENRLRDAAESCRLGLQYDPANVAGHTLLAQIALRKGDAAQGLDELRRVWALRPYDRVALYRLVQALTAQKRDREALQAAEAAFRNNPASAAFLEEYVRSLMAAEKPADAETACRIFRSAHPADEAAALLLAQALFKQGKATEAGQVLTAAAGTAVNPTSYLYRAVQVSLGAGANKSAAAFARRLVQTAPDNPGAAEALVQALNAAGQAQEAQQSAVDAAHKHPDTAAFTQLAVGALNDAKQPDRALEECTQFLSRHPDDIGMQLALAQLQIAAGRADEAVAALKKVEAADMKAAPQALEAVLRGYMRLKRYAEAEAIGRRLCEAAPDSASAWLGRAAVLEEQGGAAYERAITVYREALARPLRPQSVRALLENNLAYRLAMKALANPSESDRLLAEAETLAQSASGDRDTSQTSLLDTLGWIKLLRNKPADAAELLETAAERRDATAEMFYHYAVVCVKTGKLPLALEMATKAVERDPKHPEWLAEIKAQVAQLEKN